MPSNPPFTIVEKSTTECPSPVGTEVSAPLPSSAGPDNDYDGYLPKDATCQSGLGFRCQGFSQPNSCDTNYLENEFYNPGDWYMLEAGDYMYCQMPNEDIVCFTVDHVNEGDELIEYHLSIGCDLAKVQSDTGTDGPDACDPVDGYYFTDFVMKEQNSVYYSWTDDDGAPAYGESGEFITHEGRRALSHSSACLAKMPGCPGGCPATNSVFGSDVSLDEYCEDVCAGVTNGMGHDGASRCCFGEDSCKDYGKDGKSDPGPFLAPYGMVTNPNYPALLGKSGAVCCKGKNACYSSEIHYGTGGISCNSVTNGNKDGHDDQQSCSGAWFIEGNPTEGYPEGGKPLGSRVPISCTGLQACYQVKWMNIEPTPVDICCNGIQTCYEFGYTSSFHGPPHESTAECRDDVPDNGNENDHDTCYQASFTDDGKDGQKRTMDVCVQAGDRQKEGYNLCGSDADCDCTEASYYDSMMSWCSADVPSKSFDTNRDNIGGWHCEACEGCN